MMLKATSIKQQALCNDRRAHRLRGVPANVCQPRKIRVAAVSAVAPSASRNFSFATSRSNCAIKSVLRSCVVKAAAAETVAAAEKVPDTRIPVTVITGFLGSGKTTLLNHILTQPHGRRIAVIENEFGEIDIDSDLVARQEVLEGTADNVTVLSNGCLCCQVRDDLVDVLNKLYRRKDDFDHIVIETTGLANPAPVINTFFANQDLVSRVRLDGVVTVVDAKHVTQHLNEVKPADVVNEAVEQIAYADRIVLNKTDLVDASDLLVLEERIRAVNELASIQRTQRSKVAVDYVLGVGGFDLDKVEEQINTTLAPPPSHDHSHDHHDHDHECGPGCTHESHDHEHDHDCAPGCTHESHSHDHDHGHDHGHAQAQAHSHNHSHSHDHDHDHECGPDCTHESHAPVAAPVKHDDRVSSLSFVLEGEMDLDKINYVLGTLLEMRGEDIFRMKGILSIKGIDQRYIFHAVHQMFDGDLDREWRKGEARVNKMVFIGKYLNREDMLDALQRCLADGPKTDAAGAEKELATSA